MITQLDLFVRCDASQYLDHIINSLNGFEFVVARRWILESVEIEEFVCRARLKGEPIKRDRGLNMPTFVSSVSFGLKKRKAPLYFDICSMLIQNMQNCNTEWAHQWRSSPHNKVCMTSDLLVTNYYKLHIQNFTSFKLNCIEKFENVLNSNVNLNTIRT